MVYFDLGHVKLARLQSWQETFRRPGLPHRTQLGSTGQPPLCRHRSHPSFQTRGNSLSHSPGHENQTRSEKDVAVLSHRVGTKPPHQFTTYTLEVYSPCLRLSRLAQVNKYHDRNRFKELWLINRITLQRPRGGHPRQETERSLKQSLQRIKRPLLQQITVNKQPS